MPSNEQLALLQELQLTALAVRDQAGLRAYHEAQAWADGATWSSARVLDADDRVVFTSTVCIGPDGRETVAAGKIESLAEQRDQLAAFIAANRVNKEAA
ncbi:hypothetical protein [Halomonas koreensis]|uniref:Uncharacterized protein n=1 Tax=Halomonas koreensis TaxID=245385 RepID=A0ABU1G4X6_9GAMM|nr:hypothetical protein [Halomonas koreensis]MDR5867966.1 hypothetical protein [Halomonas koreensis]